MPTWNRWEPVFGTTWEPVGTGADVYGNRGGYVVHTPVPKPGNDHPECASQARAAAIIEELRGQGAEVTPEGYVTSWPPEIPVPSGGSSSIGSA